ncbi:Inner membrane protein YbcI [compost metagenome]
MVSLLPHRLLDALTTGGKGVGWLWLWRDERFFASWQLIRVAPFKLEAYLTARGEAVILSELYWVWLPGVVLMLVLMGWRAGGLRDAETGGQVMKIVITVPLHCAEGEQG